MDVSEIGDIKTIGFPDKKKLAILLDRAKGPRRKMTQFSEDTGITESTLSRIRNEVGKRALPIETLKKIYECRANKNDTDLFAELLEANGMEAVHTPSIALFSKDTLNSQQSTSEVIPIRRILKGKDSSLRNNRFSSSQSACFDPVYVRKPNASVSKRIPTTITISPSNKEIHRRKKGSRPSDEFICKVREIVEQGTDLIIRHADDGSLVVMELNVKKHILG